MCQALCWEYKDLDVAILVKNTIYVRMLGKLWSIIQRIFGIIISLAEGGGDMSQQRSSNIDSSSENVLLTQMPSDRGMTKQRIFYNY